MRLAIAKAEADIGAGLRALTLINREKHRCATCYFQFNVLEDNGTFKVRARADKEVCDKDLGDTECVKEQGQLRAQERRAAEKATKRLAQQETPAQPRMKKKARTKNPGHQGRQTGATNGHFPALSSIDEERA